MDMERIRYRYHQIRKISNSIPERCPDWNYLYRETFPKYFIKSYNIAVEDEVADFIEMFAIEGARVSEELSLEDFLKKVAEQGKTLPEQYEDLKKIAETAERASQTENLDKFLEEDSDIFFEVLIYFVSHDETDDGRLRKSRYQKMIHLSEFLGVFTRSSIALPEEFCREDCLKMVEVVTEFYYECLAEGRYDNFTTFFIIYCLHYIQVGLMHQLIWSEDYLFGVPKALFAGADNRLLPYLEKMCEGILALYDSYYYTNFADLGTKFRSAVIAVLREETGEELMPTLVHALFNIPATLRIFQSAADIWPDMPIANYYCFIHAVECYFNGLGSRESLTLHIEEEIQDAKEEIVAMEHEPEEKRGEDFNYHLNYWKEELAFYQGKYQERAVQLAEVTQDAVIQIMLDAYAHLPEIYQNLANDIWNYGMLPVLVFQDNRHWIHSVTGNSQYEDMRCIFSNEDYYRLGMEVNVQYPAKLIRTLLDDKQQLRQKNKELERANTDLLHAQEDRKQVINEFSHTYSNMKATTLHDIGQNLLTAASEEFRYYGRLALIEYGIKENLTKEVQLLKLRFEDNMQELLQNIRNTVFLHADNASVQIQGIVSDAWKRCFMTLLYDETTKGKDWCNFFFGKQQHGVEKIRLRDDFEESVLVKSGRYSTAAWLEQSGTILFSLSVSGEWEKFYFKADDFAALLLTDWISELFTNVIRYADRKQPVTMEFSSSGDILHISLQNQKNAIRVHNTRIGMTSMQSYLQKLNESTGYSGASMQITDEENAYQIELFLNGKIFH